jgi:hypothetical protein
MIKPRFSASEVAGILGRNPYKSKNEVLLKVLGQYPKFKPVIESVKSSLGGKTEREIVSEAPPEIQRVLAQCVAESTTARTDAEFEGVVKRFKEQNARVMLTNALNGSNVIRDLDIDLVRSAQTRIQTGQTTIERELAALGPVLAGVIDASKEQETLASEIQKRRGTKLEKVAEDAFVVETGKEITERNTFTQIECPEYRLIGYIDGFQDGKVVETKNRKRFWAVPPAYDFVQLRCYMRMKGKVDGVLLENFPAKPPRTTAVSWSDSAWESIHEGLCQVSREIAAMTHEDATLLAQTVFKR